MKTKNEKRREAITDKITMERSVSVRELSEEFKVSNETIRLDLEYLEKKGILVRIHGGAVLRNEAAEVPFAIRKQEHNEIKKSLARNLLRYIKDDSVLFIASSSTNLYLCSLLKLKKNLTIFTNSFEVISLLQDTRHTLFVIGGQFYDHGKRMIGPYAMNMIQDIYFDMCICGMDGCKGLTGPATKSHSEHNFIKMVIQHSDQKVLISDQSKFDAPANYQFADFHDFDYFFSEPLKPQHQQFFEQYPDHRPKHIIEVENW